MIYDSEIKQLIKQEFNRINAEVYAGKLPHFNFKIVDRLRNLGMFIPKLDGPCLIEINRNHNSITDVKNTIRHEIAHYAHWMFNRNTFRRGLLHGSDWQHHVIRCGGIPVTCASYTISNDIKETRRIATLQCPNGCFNRTYYKLGKVLKTHIKNPKHYCCPNCKKFLILTTYR